MPNSSVTVPGAMGSYGTGTITISSTSSSFYTTTGSMYGSVLMSGANGTSWSNIATGYNPGLSVSGDATFDGDIKWKGRSLGTLLQSIEDRLAILTTPDPAKLEKFAALKKAYDHYKLMEKLIGDE